MGKAYRYVNQSLDTVWNLILRQRLRSIGSDTQIDRGVHFDYPDNIFIGDEVRIARHTVIRANSENSLLIGDGSSVLEYCLLTSNEGSITIGKRSWLGAGTYVYGNGHVTIGDDVLIAAKCVINTVSHNFDDLFTPINLQGINVAPVIIENNVWIGLGVSILQGVRIGEGTIVGAGSLVTKDLPPYTIAFGTPARVSSCRMSGEG